MSWPLSRNRVSKGMPFIKNAWQTIFHHSMSKIKYLLSLPPKSKRGIRLFGVPLNKFITQSRMAATSQSGRSGELLKDTFTA